jgi:hypothetical protein
LSDEYDDDENEAVRWAIREAARRWTIKTHDGLPVGSKKIVERGLDMRLDKMDGGYETDLASVLKKTALRKREEIDQDRTRGAA